MKAVVVGGGIIGLCSAYYLNEAGWDVTVIDKNDFSDNCSYGNLGMIVPSHFVPLAAPGIVSQGIRWMFDSKSPFYVKPSLSLRLLKWGWRFMRSATAAHVVQSGRPLLEMNLFSKSLYENLLQQQGFDFAYEKKGILLYSRTEAVAAEEAHLADRARSMGLEVDVLTKEQVQALEPETELTVAGAVYYRCDAHLYPNRLMQQLIAVLKSKGVVLLENHALSSIQRQGAEIKSVTAGNQTLNADLFVMASGSWLPDMMKLAGLSIPLMPGKGYSFTIDEPQQRLTIPAILCEARVAITPMDNRMRFGGTMELGNMQHSVNWKRVQGIVEAVPLYFPGMKVSMPTKQSVWYGFRPCSPDGLPYIGYSSDVRNLMVAGGHAMMGLSLGPATGKLVAELAVGRKSSLDISAFNPNRFN